MEKREVITEKINIFGTYKKHNLHSRNAIPRVKTTHGKHIYCSIFLI